MTYIETIRKNAIYSTIIRKIAKDNNVDYEVAKIMYHNGKKDINVENAIKIHEILKDLKDKLYLIDYLEISDDEISSGIHDLQSIFKRISSKINRKYIQELAPYIFSDAIYGNIIYELIAKNKLSIENAINFFENNVERVKNNSGLSELAAIVKIMVYGNNEEAILFEQEYKNHKAIVGYPFITIKNALVASDQYVHSKINGITIISKTNAGLKLLERVLSYIFDNGKPEFLKQFKEKALSSNLAITDFMFNDNSNDRPFFSEEYGCIYLPKRDFLLEYLDIFYHEATHFLDYSKGNISSSVIILKQLLDKIKSNKNPIRKGLKIAFFTNAKIYKYLDDKALNQKWLDEIKKEKKIVNDDDLQQYLLQKKQYERMKYELLIKDISDIYDAISNGFVRKLGGSGHGISYYSNDDNIIPELMANLGSIFNLDGMDILVYEFGEEIATELFEIYKSFLSYGIISDEKHKL